ncbi:hypothetical protein PHLCEN_2v9103 [Hermanssonia centrifuga]|uniref:Uncharacterized protein n=1 Tax=Hermanssonia centrifuga TaxID=98765 RepID=A0A2R6NRQ5_9APHY|nr:hypothetical protein PHLCEN_2v9103 [Hermanssonia centrifuga]
MAVPIRDKIGIIRAICVKASEDKQYVDDFVYEIARKEKDKAICSKLDDLTLAEDKWERADLFIQLLVAATEKIADYYDKTGDTDAYVISMCQCVVTLA